MRKHNSNEVLKIKPYLIGTKLSECKIYNDIALNMKANFRVKTNENEYEIITMIIEVVNMKNETSSTVIR